MADGGAFRDAWLVGSDGLYSGTPGGGWERIGNYGYVVNAILRMDDGVIVGTGNGLWHVPSPGGRWIQLHDETLTEVMDLAPAGDAPGALAAFAYGVGVGRMDDLGAARWASVTGHLPVNRRYTNVLRVDPGDPGRWIAGTEDGVIVGTEHGAAWTTSDLTGTAVRGLCYGSGAWWAGTDTRGVWRSPDGLSWKPAGKGLDGRAAFCVTLQGDRILVGTDAGVAAGDGDGPWTWSGPRVRVRVIRPVPGHPETWMAGAEPGGLWMTRDAGATWRVRAGFNSVRAIDAPKEG